MTDTEKRDDAVVGVGKGPRTRKPRRRRRMLTGVSRQRRAANARERRRIQGVNDAFVELKSIIPVEQPDEVSKIETLRLAAKWIAHLTTVLIQDDRKREPSSQAHQSLPKTLQDKLHDLLQFELEDFMLISDSLNANKLNSKMLSTNSDMPQNKRGYCNESKSNVSNLEQPSNTQSRPFTNNSSAVFEGWERTCHNGDLSSSSSSSNGSCSPSDLQYLDSCDVSCMADDPLGLGPYDLDLPPLASVFSQQVQATARNHWSCFGGQYEAPQAIQTGYYR